MTRAEAARRRASAAPVGKDREGSSLSGKGVSRLAPPEAPAPQPSSLIRALRREIFRAAVLR